MKKFGLLKASMMKRIPLLVENCLNEGKILACGEIFLDKGKSFQCGKRP